MMPNPVNPPQAHHAQPFEALFYLTRDAALLIDEDQAIIDVNPAACALFHSERKRLLCVSLHDLLRKRIGALAIEMQQRLTREKSYQSEALGVCPNGQIFPVMVQALTVEAKAGPAALLLIHPSDKNGEVDAIPAAKRDELAYRASVGEMAIGVLHNVGNILNSVNISAQSLTELAKTSKIPELVKANELFEKNLNRIQEYVTADPAGRYLPEFYLNVGRYLARNNEVLAEETTELQDNLNLIKELIATQQDYAKSDASSAALNLERLVKDALKIDRLSLGRHHVRVSVDIPRQAYISAPKAKALHVLLNLIKNAKEAMIQDDATERRLAIEAERDGEARWRLRVRDTGMGMSAPQLERLFQYGFTTKLDGHGFGLYTSRKVMEDMGGTLQAHSDGPGKGAEFHLTFPAHVDAS